MDQKFLKETNVNYEKNMKKDEENPPVHVGTRVGALIKLVKSVSSCKAYFWVDSISGVKIGLQIQRKKIFIRSLSNLHLWLFENRLDWSLT